VGGKQMGKRVGVFINPIKGKKDLSDNIDKVLNQLKSTMLNNLDIDTSTKLLYWLNEWGADYLKNENNFDYKKIMRYKRGNIIKVDLGFKIGSEQGGLHYALILDNYNNKSNKVLMTVPIESLPNNKSLDDIDKRYEVFLGYGIFKDDIKYIENKIKIVESKIKDMVSRKENTSKENKQLMKLKKELESLNKGSVAQVAQTCALSKIRIYYPIHTGDRLSTFILSDDKLEEIENKFNKLYFEKVQLKSLKIKEISGTLNE
jgi:hypothetical protein